MKTKLYYRPYFEVKTLHRVKRDRSELLYFILNDKVKSKDKNNKIFVDSATLNELKRETNIKTDSLSIYNIEGKVEFRIDTEEGHVTNTIDNLSSRIKRIERQVTNLESTLKKNKIQVLDRNGIVEERSKSDFNVNYMFDEEYTLQKKQKTSLKRQITKNKKELVSFKVINSMRLTDEEKVIKSKIK